jgi:hypothetical protein
MTKAPSFRCHPTGAAGPRSQELGDCNRWMRRTWVGDRHKRLVGWGSCCPCGTEDASTLNGRQRKRCNPDPSAKLLRASGRSGPACHRCYIPAIRPERRRPTEGDLRTVKACEDAILLRRFAELGLLRLRASGFDPCLDPENSDARSRSTTNVALGTPCLECGAMLFVRVL